MKTKVAPDKIRVEGQKAPRAADFNLPDQNGKFHQLSDYSGKWLVVYFYPRDNTPGCTKEACSFRDTSSEFKKRGVEVVGISKDTVVSHKKFTDTYGLHFTLLADPQHQVIESYGAWGAKKFMGREFFGTLRNTYLINPKGEIVRAYKGVDPLTHAKQLLSELDFLM